MLDTFDFTSDVDDTPLRGYCWRNPDAAVRANVIIAHGAAEHAARYDEFARTLTRTDAAIWALDHRGHGALAASLGDFGPAGWDGLVADVNQLVSRASDRVPDVPTVLFGHSMGSLAAQQIMVDRSRLLDGVVLSGSTCFDVLAEAAADGAGLASFNAPFDGPGATGFEWLSRDAEAVAAYLADPLCGQDLSEAAVTGMFTAAARIADPDELRRIRNDLPVLIVAGDADPLNLGFSLIEMLAERYAQAGLVEVVVERRDGARHEVLNEVDREAVQELILRWLDGVIARY